MLVFGYAATFEIHHVPTVVLDLDHSQESRELISRFTSSPYFDVQRQLTDSRANSRSYRSGPDHRGLEIDAGFAQKLRSGRDRAAASDCGCDQLEYRADCFQLHFTDRAWLCPGLSEDRIYRIAPQLIEACRRSSLNPAWYNPGLSSRWFFVPGIIGSLTLVLVITLTAFAVVREREIGTLEQIMVTPIRPAEFILGKTLPFFLIGLFDVSLIAVVGTLWFQVPFRGHSRYC